MDVRNLRHILAVAQYGSVARAAEALDIAQASLSKSIARIEDKLKVRLFDRTPHGSELTAIGQILADRAARVLAETQALVRDIQLVAGEPSVVRIGIGPALQGRFSHRLVQRLVEQHPDLDLTIDFGGQATLVSRLVSRELDVVFCAWSDDLVGADLVAEEILRTQAVVVAAPGHPLAQVRGITLERLAEHPLAGPALPGFTAADVLGSSPETDNLHFYSGTAMEPLMTLAELGVATLLAAEHVVAPSLRSGRLVRLDYEVDFPISMVSVCVRAASYSPILGRIVRYARAIGDEIEAA